MSSLTGAMGNSAATADPIPTRTRSSSASADTFFSSPRLTDHTTFFDDLVDATQTGDGINETIEEIGEYQTLDYDQLHAIFDQLDDDHDGRIDYAQFKATLQARENEAKLHLLEDARDDMRGLRDEAIMEVFNFVDMDNNGYVDLMEFEAALKRLQLRALWGNPDNKLRRKGTPPIVSPKQANSMIDPPR